MSDATIANMKHDGVFKSHLPIFVVSLPSAIERRERISSQLAGYEGWWAYLDGVVPDSTPGVQWKPGVSVPLAPKILGRHLSKGEFGCALSHVVVLERIVQEQLSAAIILEDDAILAGDLEHICHAALESIDFDVLLIGYSKVAANDACLRGVAEPVRSLTKCLGHNIGVAYRERRSGTVAYLVTQVGACKMLAIQGKVKTVADDWPYFRSQGLKILHIRPSLVREDFVSTESSIAKDRLIVEGARSKSFPFFRLVWRLIRGVIWLAKMHLQKKHAGFYF